MRKLAAIEGRKTNKDFMILSFFGIIFVLFSHLIPHLAPFESIFPLDSFFMPMFVFISGYFFSVKKIESGKSFRSFLLSKVTRLLIPFLLWVLFYWIITTILNSTGVYNLSEPKQPFGLFLIHLITFGTSFGYNDPSWFALLLFYISVIYGLLRFLLKKAWIDSLALPLFVIIGAVSVYLAQTNFNDYPFATLLLKIMFYLQYFELGIFYRKFIEKYHNSFFSLLAIMICVVINFILISIFGNTLSFRRTLFMDGFNTSFPLLPFITSVTGILFWLSISKLLAPVLGKSRFVNFVSNNTFFIMVHHTGIKALFYLFYIILKNQKVPAFINFDETAYFSKPDYFYFASLHASILIFILTTIGTIIACFIYVKIKNLILSFARKRLNLSKNS